MSLRNLFARTEGYPSPSIHNNAVRRRFAARLIAEARRAAARRQLDGEPKTTREKIKQAGQVIVIFAVMLVCLLGLVGFAIDASWAWENSLQIQRAADAGALAGVVYLPGDQNGARTTAAAEVTKNGYAGATLVATFPASNPRELDLSVTSKVQTFFVNLFGVKDWTITRAARAIYVMPVPMGSPLSYYGVYQLCNMSSSCSPMSNPPSGSVSSQGFFGAIEAQGSNRGTGDAFATYYDPNPTTNSQYTSDGYRYTVTTGAGTGNLYLFDPVFCATGTKPSGGHSGAGDHWLGAADNSTNGKTSTYFILWDMHGQPLNQSAWTKAAYKYEVGQWQVDRSATYGYTGTTGWNYSDGNEPPSTVTDCQANPEHNRWVPMTTTIGGATAFTLAANTMYSLQITTTDPASPNGNLSQSFENMFSVAVTNPGSAVYGSGAMITYANVDSGAQDFYLAQIDAVSGAGNTVVIDLFDPGDVGSPSWLQILPPDGSPAYAPTYFDYTADNGRHATHVNCLQTYAGTGGSPPAGCAETASSGGTLYQDSWVHISIRLPSAYGSASDPLTNGGWWKIKYIVNSANDTTTWQVSIQGYPVHLLP